MKKIMKGLDPIVMIICIVAYTLTLLLAYDQLITHISFPNSRQVLFVVAGFAATVITSFLANLLEKLKLRTIRRKILAANYCTKFDYFTK